MKIDYLTNTYPNPSCTFIRREIAALEANGLPVLRFAIRPSQANLIDEADQKESLKTRHILKIGAIRLLLALGRTLLTKPLDFLKTCQLMFKIGIKGEKNLLYHFIYLIEACVLLDWSNQDSIDHIHVHFGTNATAVAMFCQSLGGPSYSFTVHGPEEFDKVEAIALPEKIKRANFVVAISSFGRSQLLRWCAYKDWSKIQVVHCGLDAMFLSQPYVPLPTEPRFVSVCRLSEQKGLSLLVEAVGQLAAENLKFKLVLVGDGPLRSEIEGLIKHLNLEDYIQLTGWATNLEVKQQILDSQVMILPSFAEGLPVVIMESLALARPVLTTYIAGIPELIQPNRSGWLVPAGSVEELVITLRQILQCPLEELTAMGKMGAKMVMKDHNALEEAKKLIKLFQAQIKAN